MNFFLSSCIKDIKSKLRQLKVAQTSVILEKDLILARVGLCDLEGNNMTVCQKHWAVLGMWWRCISHVTMLCMAISDENLNEEQASRCVKR